VPAYFAGVHDGVRPAVARFVAADLLVVAACAAVPEGVFLSSAEFAGDPNCWLKAGLCDRAAGAAGEADPSALLSCFGTARRCRATLTATDPNARSSE